MHSILCQFSIKYFHERVKMNNTGEKNSSNETARKYLEEIFESWDQVSYNEKTDTVYRKPQTKEKIESSQVLINKVKALNPDDEWVLNRIKELQDVLDYQNKREYSGSKFIPKFLMLFGGLALLANLFIVSDPTADSAIKWRDKQIVKIEKRMSKTEQTIYQIKEKRENYADWTDEDRAEEIVEKQVYLQKYKSEINDLKDLSSDAVFKIYQEKQASNRRFGIIISTAYLLAGLFYKKAFSARRYISEKVNHKAEKFEKAGTITIGIFERIVRFLMSAPDVKVTTRYKDGTSESTTHNPLFWLGAFLWIFVPLMLIAYYINLAPLAVLIAYYGNYIRNK